MNTKERYNCLIDAVEEGVAAQKSDNEIVNLLCAELMCDRRVLGEIFKFMTGISTMQYIGLRRMMKAYSHFVINGGNLDEAINYSGLENNNSFDKKFRQIFDLPPKEAKKKKDESLYQEPMTWGVISAMEIIGGDSMSSAKAPILRFGIDQSKLMKYNEAMELQALYGFNDDQAEMAYDFSEKNKISLQRAFECIEAAIDAFSGENFILCQIEEYAEKLPDHILSYAEQLLYVLQNSNLSLKRADYLVYLIIQPQLFGAEMDISEFGIEPLLLFESSMNSFFSYGDFLDAYSYFKDKVNGTDDRGLWDEYVRQIVYGCSLKEAFERAEDEWKFFKEGLASLGSEDDCMNDAIDQEVEWRFDEEEERINTWKPWDYNHREDEEDY